MQKCVAVLHFTFCLKLKSRAVTFIQRFPLFNTKCPVQFGGKVVKSSGSCFLWLSWFELQSGPEGLLGFSIESSSRHPLTYWGCCGTCVAMWLSHHFTRSSQGHCKARRRIKESVNFCSRMDHHDWQRGRSRGHRRYDDDDGEKTITI